MGSAKGSRERLHGSRDREQSEPRVQYGNGSGTSSRSRSRSRSRSPSSGRRKGRNRRPNPLQLQGKALKHVVGGDVRRLRKLLRRNKRHLNLAAADSEGRTLLHHACACGREDVVALLLRREAPAGPRDACGDTPAHLAARSGHLATLAEVMRAPDAPPLDAAGARGTTLRELMGRALGGSAIQGPGQGSARGGPCDQLPARAQQEVVNSESEDDGEARWRRRLREEYSDSAGGAEDEDWDAGGRVDWGGGETDDEWANRLWREMQRRRSAAAAASSASFTADLRAEAAKRAAEAAERSQRILQGEKAKDAEWRRRTLMALEAGPATPAMDLSAVRASYDQRWAHLDVSTPSAAAPGAAAGPSRGPTPSPTQTRPLRYDEIPWPLEPPPLPAARKGGPAQGDLRPGPPPGSPPAAPPPAPSVEALRDFLLLGASGPADVKRRLRGELLRWHPDKFGARFGPCLAAAGPAHRAAALVRVQQLAQVLTQVLGTPGSGG